MRQVPWSKRRLQGMGYPPRPLSTRAFITWVMDQFLIGCASGVPARRNLRDFARFIAATSLDARGLPPPEARWERTLQAAEALKVGDASTKDGAVAPLPPMVSLANGSSDAPRKEPATPASSQ